MESQVEEQEIVHTEDSFINTRGKKIFTQQWRVPNPKAVIILLHGYSDHSHDRITDDGNKFSHLGYSCYTMDHEGHGKSEGLSAYITSFKYLVDDVLHYVGIAESQNPGKRIFMYGQSMGGAICLLASLREPARFSGVILIAPMVKIVDSMKPHPIVVWVLKILSRWFPTLAIVPTKDIIDIGIKSEEKRKATRENPLGYNGKVRLATGMAILEVTEYLQNHLYDVSVPLLICHGTDDLVTSPQVSETLYKEAQSKDKTLKLYKGMWHALTAEPEAHLVYNDIVSWILERSSDKPVCFGDIALEPSENVEILHDKNLDGASEPLIRDVKKRSKISLDAILN